MQKKCFGSVHLRIVRRYVGEKRKIDEVKRKLLNCLNGGIFYEERI